MEGSTTASSGENDDDTGKGEVNDSSSPAGVVSHGTTTVASTV